VTKERYVLNRRSMLVSAAALIAVAPSCTAASAQKIKVYKDASCGCCGAWVDHLKAAGFATEVDDSQDMASIKAKYGVPDDLTSCHTGVIEGYAIEGHVPVDDIKRLLKEKPKALGIAVPGMPVNSPGMEVPGEANERYTVWLFQKDGTRTAFAEHGG
jgi:hypothetical protein